jgi:hypothetical protein
MNDVCTLSISLIREFRVIRNSTEKHTSQAVVISVVVHQGERPPGDQAVGSEHRTHACLCSIYAIHRQMEVSLCR